MALDSVELAAVAGLDRKRGLEASRLLASAGVVRIHGGQVSLRAGVLTDAPVLARVHWARVLATVNGLSPVGRFSTFIVFSCLFAELRQIDEVVVLSRTMVRRRFDVDDAWVKRAIQRVELAQVWLPNKRVGGPTGFQFNPAFAVGGVSGDVLGVVSPSASPRGGVEASTHGVVVGDDVLMIGQGSGVVAAPSPPMADRQPVVQAPTDKGPREWVRHHFGEVAPFLMHVSEGQQPGWTTARPPEVDADGFLNFYWRRA